MGRDSRLAQPLYLKSVEILRSKCKKATLKRMAFAFGIIAGDHLISHTVPRAVPSAQRGLTSVFGMGTGDPSQYGHRQSAGGIRVPSLRSGFRLKATP